MMKRVIQILLFLLFVSTVSLAQTTPELYVEKFFTEFKSKGAKEAVANLYSTNKWMSRVQDAVDDVKSKLASYDEELVGKHYGYEFITKKELGESYVLLSYLVKYDRQPLRFTFQFYKPDQKWVLYSFQFDDSFDDELEKAAEINFLTK